MSHAVPEGLSNWQAARPTPTTDYSRDKAAFAPFWDEALALLRRLPRKGMRDADAARAAATILRVGHASRDAFLAAHGPAVYDRLTRGRSRFLRVEALLAGAAVEAPGLVPDTATLAREDALAQRDKDGHEIDHGLFLHHILGDPVAGAHLCHAMLLPKPDSPALADKFARDGRIDLGGARVERRAGVAIATLSNPRFLNAEDESNLEAFETAVDVCLLDAQSQVCLLRGDRVAHPKYAGQRVFNSGINLTLLYQGKIGFAWYLRRDLGTLNKIYRGLARPETSPEDVMGETTEKLWVAQVDRHAIGGGCQILLVCDYVVAGAGAYMTLPARKEGIIPGFANLRLPRFVGDRVARRAIQSEFRLDCDSPHGRMICDEIAPADQLDPAGEAAALRFAGSGAFGAVANRRALRLAQEPLDMFRRYAAYYAKAQAQCHFSPQLIENLERYWNAQSRKA